MRLHCITAYRQEATVDGRSGFCRPSIVAQRSETRCRASEAVRHSLPHRHSQVLCLYIVFSLWKVVFLIVGCVRAPLYTSLLGYAVITFSLQSWQRRQLSEVHAVR